MSLRPGGGGGSGSGLPTSTTGNLHVVTTTVAGVYDLRPEADVVGGGLSDLVDAGQVSTVRTALLLGRTVAPDASDLVVLARDTALASTTLPNTGSAGGSITMSASGVISAAGLAGVSSTALLVHSGANAHHGLATQIAASTIQSATLSGWFKSDGTIEYDPSLIAYLKHTSAGTWSSPWGAFELGLNTSSPSVKGTLTTTSASVISLTATTSNSARVRAQTWHHCGVSYDHTSGAWKLYLDGQQVGAGTTTAAPISRAADGGSFGIGGALYGGSQQRPWGLICDVRLANVARAASWFREVYRRGVGVWEGS